MPAPDRSGVARGLEGRLCQEGRTPSPALPALLLAATIAFILYGSLYPFRFTGLPPGAGFADTLEVVALEAILSPPLGGRGDVLANLLLYLPFGFLLTASLSGRLRAVPLLCLALLCGGLLSVAVEAAQLFLPRRTSSSWDVLCNGAGSLAGGAAALLLGWRRGGPVHGLRGLAAEPFAALLVLAWLGYRLYPYVPTLDLQAVRDSLKPLLLAPSLEPLRSARLAACWVVVACLIEAVAGRQLGRLLVPGVLLGSLGAEMLVVSRALTLAEVVGVALALCGWALLRHRPHGALPVLAVVMAAVIVAGRLEPFTFDAAAKPFGWVPFRSLIRGAWEAGLQAMLEKGFLYGSLLWLLVRAGIALPLTAMLGGLLLLGTSLAQRHLPGRSGEITDMVLVLLLAAIFHLLEVRGRWEAAGLRRNP